MHRHAEAHVQGFDLLAAHQHLVWKVGDLAVAFEIDDGHLVRLVDIDVVLGGRFHSDADNDLIRTRDVDAINLRQRVAPAGEPGADPLREDVVRIAGGEAGMRHFISQFGPALQWNWTKLMDVPDLTEELIEMIASQSVACTTPSRSSKPVGVCIHEFSTRIQNALMVVPKATSTVASV